MKRKILIAKRRKSLLIRRFPRECKNCRETSEHCKWVVNRKKLYWCTIWKIWRSLSEEDEATSLIMINKKIDEFEEKVREKLKADTKIFSSKLHSQEFLRSLIPSLKDKK